MMLVVAGGAGAARLDPGFGDRGVVKTPTGATGLSYAARAVTRDRAGRLLAAGGVGDFMIVARYRRQGRLDTTFGGGDGFAVIGPWPQNGPGAEASASALAVRRDGKILVAGTLDRTGAGGRAVSCGGIARLRPNGSLDKRFGPRRDGKVSGCGRQWFSLALLPRGRFLVSGIALSRGAQEPTAVVARFKADGRRDLKFGPRGTGALLIGTARRGGCSRGSGALDLLVLRSGKILVSGYNRLNFMLARVTRRGRLDPGFGRRGKVITDVTRRRGCGTSIGWGMTRDRRGRILVTGYVQPPNPKTFVVLVRHLPDGDLDRAFGRRGIAQTRLGSFALARQAAIQRNGRIVVAGVSGSPENPRFTVLRYRPRGRLDRSFFRRGVLRRSFGGAASARDVIVDRRGRPVIAGGYARGSVRGFVLMRLLAGRR